jgi:hypothetical protein
MLINASGPTAVHSEIIFFDLLLLIIGNQLTQFDCICGITFAKTKDLIEIWYSRTAPVEEIKLAIICNINDALSARSLETRIGNDLLTSAQHGKKRQSMKVMPSDGRGAGRYPRWDLSFLFHFTGNTIGRKTTHFK